MAMTVAVHRSPSTSRSALVLVGSLVLVGLVAAIGGLAAANAGSDYQNLDRPAWAPPAGLFGPVWTALYIAMAVAAWLVWREIDTLRDRALGVYAVQLALNLAWTPLFFAAEWRTAALIDIVLLDLAVIVTIVLFLRRSRIAAGLLMPYLVWTLFATALNAYIVVAN